MQEPRSGTSASRNGASDPSARPGNVLSNPAVQQNFYDANQSIAGPARLAFDPKNADTEAEAKVRLLAKYSRYRNRAVWAQALVLFNVIGIPLSQGMYLGYYFNTALPRSSIIALSVIPALQIGILLTMPTLVGWFYRWRGPRSGWKILFCAATVIAVAVQLALQWNESYILTVALQGPLLGAALGTLFTLSMLVLSSHYQFNLSVVSMQSGFVGFLGALVYAIIARQGLQARGNGFFAPAVSAGVLAGTLSIAFLLIRRVDAGNTLDNMRKLRSGMKLSKILGETMKEKGTIWFILGYILVFSGLFIFPIYITLILTQPPSQLNPDTASHTLISLLATAAISASTSANPVFRKRLGPVDTFVASSILAGAASLLPAWMPTLPVALGCGAAYGVGLGAIAALHIKVTTVFRGDGGNWPYDMPVKAAVMMLLGGGSAVTGLVVSGIIMETVAKGVQIVASGSSVCLILGGAFVAFARWKRCQRFYIAI
jgi:hypothetical protein